MTAEDFRRAGLGADQRGSIALAASLAFGTVVASLVVQGWTTRQAAGLLGFGRTKGIAPCPTPR